MSKKEVTKATSTDVAVPSMDDFGVPDVTSKDILIPKVLCMQKMSKLVEDEKAKVGDFVDSLTGDVIASIVKPLEFIPFYLEKLWFRSRKEGTRFKLEEITPVTPENEGRRYQEMIGGNEYRNEKHMQFYCILPHDPTLPYIITFKVKSERAGKALATQMYVKNRAAGKTPAAKVMALSGHKEENEAGSFIVLDTKVVRESTPEEINTCLEWFRMIKAGQAKVHHEETPEDTKTYGGDNTEF